MHLRDDYKKYDRVRGAKEIADFADVISIHMDAVFTQVNQSKETYSYNMCCVLFCFVVTLTSENQK